MKKHDTADKPFSLRKSIINYLLFFTSIALLTLVPALFLPLKIYPIFFLAQIVALATGKKYLRRKR